MTWILASDWLRVITWPGLWLADWPAAAARARTGAPPPPAPPPPSSASPACSSRCSCAPRLSGPGHNVKMSWCHNYLLIMTWSGPLCSALVVTRLSAFLCSADISFPRPELCWSVKSREKCIEMDSWAVNSFSVRYFCIISTRHPIVFALVSTWQLRCKILDLISLYKLSIQSGFCLAVVILLSTSQLRDIFSMTTDWARLVIEITIETKILNQGPS